jgi:hypothetical protein
MKTFVAALALVSLVATSAWARTESPVVVRSGALSSFKADRSVARPATQSYALLLGVAF